MVDTLHLGQYACSLLSKRGLHSMAVVCWHETLRCSHAGVPFRRPQRDKKVTAAHCYSVKPHLHKTQCWAQFFY
jgi:hypothetical protein